MSPGAILDERRSYVAGRWVDGDDVVVVENPADESVVAELAATPLAEVERAIGEARRSFDEGVWAERPARERAEVLLAVVDHLGSLHEQMVASMVAEAGQPALFAEMAQFAAGMAFARNTIELFLSLPEEESNPVPVDELTRGRVALSIRRHEPVGVVAAITPYNGAVIMAFQKLIPALMAGNSVILRPSPLTPLSSLAFGAAAEAAGLPAGVLSVVVEAGAAGAELLTTDPAVDMVSFTGSTAVGRQILAQAAPTVKRVALELGGKSAQIYLPDALHRVAQGAAQVVAMTAGQACVAAHADARAPRAQGRGARSGDRRLLRHEGRSAQRSGRRHGSAHHAPRSGSGASASSLWPKNAAERSSAAARGRRTSHVATTSSRRSSTSPTTPTPPPRRRSSVPFSP